MTLSPLDREFVLGGLAPLLLVLAVLVWFRRRRRDEIFVGVTPGELPVDGRGRTRRLRGSGQWDGPVAVRFTPPDGVSPGLAGTVVDGSADAVDVSATVIDLARRGHLTLTAVHAPDERPLDGVDAPREALDWRLERQHSDDPVRPFERELLDAVFAAAPQVLLSSLKGDFLYTMRSAQIALYREVVDNGWYVEHPRARNRRLGCLGLPVLLAGAVLTVALALAVRGTPGWGPAEVVPGPALVVAGGLLLWGGRGRTPRTAAGTALRIQTLGFREYLQTAEADQIRFEEARDVFSRYLPYAIVFGCAERWARLLGEVAARAHLAGTGEAVFDLDWLDGLGLVFDLGRAGADVVGLGADLADAGADALQLIDAFDGPGLVEVGQGLGDLVPTDLVDVLGNGLGEIASGLGDFVSSVGDLLDAVGGCGDGCDGCDGCGI